MDSSTSSASTSSSSRTETSARASQRSGASASDKSKKQNAAPAPKPADLGVTVKGRFDPDLRRFFVTILDTSSQTLIAQFPSQAVARYVQQLKRAAAEGEPAPKDADSPNAQDQGKLNQTT